MRKIFFSLLLIVITMSLSGCETVASQTLVPFDKNDLPDQNEQIVHKRTGEPVFVGYHDESNCQIGARGWVKDLNFTGPVKVGIWLDWPYDSPLAKKVGEVTANIFRPDLPFEDKDHGFRWDLPDDLKDNFYTYYVYVLDSNGEPERLLSRSAKDIYCGDSKPLPVNTRLRVMVDKLKVHKGPGKEYQVSERLQKDMVVRIKSVHTNLLNEMWYRVSGDDMGRFNRLMYITANPEYTKEDVERTDIKLLPDTVKRWVEMERTAPLKKIRVFEENEKGEKILVVEALISTGLQGRTPVGDFFIDLVDDDIRREITQMRGYSCNEVTCWISYDLTGISYTQFFFGEMAFHTRYWRPEVPYGGELSHGCVNLNFDVSKWLYHWADDRLPGETRIPVYSR